MFMPNSYVPTRVAIALTDVTHVILSKKCTEWPQTELDHLTVKNTLYTLFKYPQGPHFGPFRDTRFPKVGNALNDLRMILNINGQTYPIYTQVPFRSTTSRFRYTRLSKYRENNLRNYLERLTVKKYPVHTRCIPLSASWSPNFGPFRSKTRRFEI